MYLLTIGEEDKLVEEYLAGASPSELSNKYHYNRGTITSLMKRRHIIRSNSDAQRLACKLGRKNISQFSDKEESKLVEEYLSGASPSELSSKYGYNCKTISNLMQRFGVRRTQREAKQLADSVGRSVNNKGCNHPNWISDRTKISKKYREGADSFVAEILNDRNYTCELTGKIGGELQVHHIKPVWSHPELQLCSDNVIVIQRVIHKEFHRIFGTKTNEHAWKYFVKAELYKKVI